MENWGLITYHDKVIDITEDECLYLVTHEISHHWFGDLVTPKWWNFLWLSEGFAPLMEIIIVNLVGAVHSYILVVDLKFVII